MLVAKLPGSTYATAATKAGPRKGTSARRPRVWPVSAFSAARRTRSSPGSATATGSGTDTGGLVLRAGSTGFGAGASTATLASSLDEYGPGEPKRDAHPPALDADHDWALVLAHRHHLEARSGHQPAALELAEAGSVVVRHSLHDHLRAGAALAQGALAQGPYLAAGARDGVTVRVELGPAEEIEDALLHSLRDHVLEALGLVVHLVPAVAQHLDEEHLQQAVMAHQLQSHLAALAGQLLALVSVVLDQALRGEAGDHLADRRRRDAQALSQVAGRHGSLVTVQVIERLEVVLLRAGERRPPRAAGLPQGAL